jgi:ferredoxin
MVDSGDSTQVRTRLPAGDVVTKTVVPHVPGLWQVLEHAIDRVTSVRDNPLRQLGALGFFFFWIITVTGVYLYAVFDTSVRGAWESVDYLTREQWYLGGVMRSLHRYASAAFALVIVAHLLKEILYRRFSGFRVFSWLTGLPLIWLAWAAGLGGYWLVWDQLAQFSVISTAEWLDALGVFGEPLARNFISPEAVSDRFFSLLVFLHIGTPLLLLLGMWVHIQRISHAAVLPSRRLATWISIALLGTSVFKPALSAAPADLTQVPAQVSVDWFYMFIHPLMYATSPQILWWLAGGATLLLAALPLLVRQRQLPKAVVDARNCNGCARCVADCPYAAVSLVRHSLSSRYTLQALVDADRCASCGICVGACPSATPFRSASTLISGIEIPGVPLQGLRERLRAALESKAAQAPVIVFGCDSGVDVESIAGPDVAVFSLPCSGMLPPAFIGYALRAGARGVVICVCEEGDCAYRLGDRWTVQRILADASGCGW